MKSIIKVKSAQNCVICVHPSSKDMDTIFFYVGGDRTGHAHLLGYDLLDVCIGRLHTNFQISATLSKKVLIFVPKCPKKTFYWDIAETPKFKLTRYRTYIGTYPKLNVVALKT